MTSITSPSAGAEGNKSEKPVFITDVDSVLVDICTPIQEILEEQTGFYIDQSDWFHWDLGETFGLPPETIDKMWREFAKRASKPYEGAVEFVRALREKFHVIGISHRKGDLRIAGLRDFACLGLDETYCISGDKGSFTHGVLKVKPVGYIDDKIANLTDMLRAFPLTPPRLFLFDQPWNISLDLDVPYVRVSSYEDILTEVLGK